MGIYKFHRKVLTIFFTTVAVVVISISIYTSRGLVGKLSPIIKDVFSLFKHGGVEFCWYKHDIDYTSPALSLELGGG